MYQTFIGLEVHIHLLTKTKVFCSCKAAFGDEPNTNICPVCMGHPGVLPSLNLEALRMGGIVARALNCHISEKTWFERKQYFYPDMPKNYQISQFASPLGTEGYLELPVDGKKKRIRIKECHLEEDAGKMIHAGNVSLLDYNRAGTALLEIVSEPDLESGEEAEQFIQQLRRIVRYLGVCDGNMEEGSLRADANVSINTPGAGLGKKVEIKNLNSSRFVRLGLDYEIKRQSVLMDEGGEIRQETRLWNENRDQTEIMRTKEDSHDYRYFPEPDLPVFAPDAAFLASIEAAQIELPQARVERFIDDYSLSPAQADLICEEREQADYFEQAITAAVSSGLDRADAASRCAAWFSSDLKRIMKAEAITASALAAFSFSPAHLAELVTLISRGRLSSKNAKRCLELAVREKRGVEELMLEKGWEQLNDPVLIQNKTEEICQKEADSFDQAVCARKEGNKKRYTVLTSFLTGKVLAATDGRADPVLVQTSLQKLVEAALDTTE